MKCIWFQSIGLNNPTRGQRPVIEDKKWLSVHNRALKSKLPIDSVSFLLIEQMQFMFGTLIKILINNTQRVLSIDVVKLLCI